MQLLGALDMPFKRCMVLACLHYVAQIALLLMDLKLLFLTIHYKCLYVCFTTIYSTFLFQVQTLFKDMAEQFFG